jgi:hypothetical protein
MQLVQVRGLEPWMPVTAQVPIPLVIGHYQNNVGLGGRLNGKPNERKQGKYGSHFLFCLPFSGRSTLGLISPLFASQ